MASTYSQRFRLNFQAPGDNLNTWGTALNTGVFQLLEDAIAKRVAFNLSGSRTLNSANGAADEARCAYLDVTGGTGGTITAPSVEKTYVVRNGSTGSLIVTTGAGRTVSIPSGEVASVVCDAVNFDKIMPVGAGAPATTIANITDYAADQVARQLSYQALGLAYAVSF